MKQVFILLQLCSLTLCACSISSPGSNGGTNSSAGGVSSSLPPDSENGYKTIEECTNEQACYNTLLFAKKQKIEKYKNLSEEEQNSITLISGHGDLVTNKGSGVIFVSYSFMNAGSKVVCNESYTLKDYGVLDNRYFYNTISFRSDESSCENGEKGTSLYIDTEAVNFFFKKYQNSSLPMKKKTFEISFYNWDGTFLRKDSIEGYGTRVPTPEAVKPADKTFYYTLSGWKTDTGAYFDLLAREDVSVTAYFEQKYVEYTITVNNYNGEEIGTRKGHYQQSQTITLAGSGGNMGREIYYSWDLHEIENGDTWYLFDGFEEEEHVASITPGYSIISGSRETHLYDTYHLEPIEDNFTMTAKFVPQPAYDSTSLGDGTYRISLYHNLIYEDSLYGGTAKTATIPSKAFIYNGNVKTILGDVAEIGEFCFSPKDYVGSPYGMSSVPQLAHLILPSTLKKIGKAAFYYCDSLQEIALNHGLETVGDYAFANTAVRTVYIPRTVREIGRTAFSVKNNNNAVIQINYEGTEEEWNNIAIHSDNPALNKASISYGVSF